MAAINNRIVKCKECGVMLDEASNGAIEERVPCPSCGSTARLFDMEMKAEIVLRSKLGLKARHPSTRKPFVESVAGSDLWRKMGRWMRLSRHIDREDDRYDEVIRDPKTGEIMHECHERLSKHRGHGTAGRMSNEERYPLPKSARITAVHKDLQSTVYRFRTEMLRAEADLPKEVTFEAGPASASLLRMVEAKQLSQMYSRAVQVFALLTVEAFLNEYGYLRFGPEMFEKRFGRTKPIAKKLTGMLVEVFGTAFDGESEIAQVVKSLADCRNLLVHPRPELEAWADDGTLETATAKRVPATDTRSAEAAVQEMDRFFELFKSIDGHAAFLLGHIK